MDALVVGSNHSLMLGKGLLSANSPPSISSSQVTSSPPITCKKSYKTSGFPIDSFLEDSVDSMISGIRSDGSYDMDKTIDHLAYKYVLPAMSVAAGLSKDTPDGDVAAIIRSAFSASTSLWRPVYWQLCLSEYKSCREGSKPLSVFRTSRESIIYTDGLNIRRIVPHVLGSYEKRADAEKKTLNAILASEVKQRYLPLIHGILERYSLDS